MYVSHSHELVVIKIYTIFLLTVNGDSHVFVNGFEYDQIGLHLHSGNPTVVATNRKIMVTGRDIIRKVMLYPDEDDRSFSVIDYRRENLLLTPGEVLIPQYPEPDDMVAVNGDNDETWLAHIQHTNSLSKLCQVYFYVKDIHNDKLYRKESNRLHQVHWNTVLSIVSGTWLNRFTQFLVQT